MSSGAIRTFAAWLSSESTAASLDVRHLSLYLFGYRLNYRTGIRRWDCAVRHSDIHRIFVTESRTLIVRVECYGLIKPLEISLGHGWFNAMTDRSRRFAFTTIVASDRSMSQTELVRHLVALGYENQGPSNDRRYDRWVRVRPARTIFVPNSMIVDYTAERIPADAAR